MVGEIKKDIVYKDYLSKVIPVLNGYSFLSGTEGSVFFVDNDFVVKTYHEPIVDVKFFNSFFKEIQSFGDAGYAVPKVYSYALKPSKGGSGFSAYVLQERIKGKKLFDLDILNIYECCKKFCSLDEFNMVVEDGENNPELLGMIIREFILGFLNTNKNLLDFSETELEKFISTDFYLSSNSRFSIPDVQAGNVIFDGKKLTIIDNGYLGYDGGLDSENMAKKSVMRDMILLFYYNEIVNKMPKYKCMCSDEINRLKSENIDASFLAMRRFVRKANEMYSPVIDNAFDYEACESVANEVFDEKKAKEICSEIQRDF